MIEANKELHEKIHYILKYIIKDEFKKEFGIFAWNFDINVLKIITKIGISRVNSHIIANIWIKDINNMRIKYQIN